MVIQLNSSVIYYEHYGEGQPLILLHGNGEDHQIFDPLGEQLSSGFEIRNQPPDCTGFFRRRDHGPSSCDRAPGPAVRHHHLRCKHKPQRTDLPVPPEDQKRIQEIQRPPAPNDAPGARYHRSTAGNHKDPHPGVCRRKRYCQKNRHREDRKPHSRCQIANSPRRNPRILCRGQYAPCQTHPELFTYS